MSYHRSPWATAGLGDAVSSGIDMTGASSDCYREGATRDRAVACAGEAGGKAAAAACVATPGLQLAAPLCGEVGKFLSEKLAGPIYDGVSELIEDIFGGPKGISPYQAFAAGMWNVQGAKNAYEAAAAKLVHLYRRTVYPELAKVDPAAPADLSYETAYRWLDVAGAKHTLYNVIERKLSAPDYVSNFRCWFAGEWWKIGVPLGSMSPAAACNFALVADPGYTDLWRADIARALGRALVMLTNQAAIAHAKAQAKAQAEALTQNLRQQPAPATSMAGPVALAAAVGFTGWMGYRALAGRKKRRR